MEFAQHELDLVKARALRSQYMAKGLRVLATHVAGFMIWLRWNGEIAMTSRRLGPVDGPRGPLTN